MSLPDCVAANIPFGSVVVAIISSLIFSVSHVYSAVPLRCRIRELTKEVPDLESKRYVPEAGKYFAPFRIPRPGIQGQAFTNLL